MARGAQRALKPAKAQRPKPAPLPLRETSVLRDGRCSIGAFWVLDRTAPGPTENRLTIFVMEGGGERFGAAS